MAEKLKRTFLLFLRNPTFHFVGIVRGCGELLEALCTFCCGTLQFSLCHYDWFGRELNKNFLAFLRNPTFHFVGIVRGCGELLEALCLFLCGNLKFFLMPLWLICREFNKTLLRKPHILIHAIEINLDFICVLAEPFIRYPIQSVKIFFLLQKVMTVMTFSIGHHYLGVPYASIVISVGHHYLVVPYA